MRFKRGWIAVFLFSLTMINYMDRIALSIAATPIAKDFNLNAIELGYLFSAFIWGYALFLIPMGFLIDRYGAKKMAGIGIFVWSAATALTGVVTGFTHLIIARLVMGAGESVSNPVGAKVIRQWIPASERGMTTAVFNSGSYAGPAICSVLLGALVTMYGWRISFAIAGAIGFVWLIAWWLFFDTPQKAKWLSEEERTHILGNLSTNAGSAQHSEDRAQGLLALMKTPTLWGLAITQGCNVYTQYLFLTWLPSYLQATMNLDIKHTGVFSAVPYAAAVILCIFVGRLSDKYLMKGGVGTGRRRNAVALSMLVGATILFVPFTSNPTVILIVLSVALTGVASTTSLNFALLNDMLPTSKDVAKAMAFVVVGGNIFGMIAPIATGYVVQASGSYNWAFGIAGLLLLTGISVVMTMTRRPMETNAKFLLQEGKA
ncbi:MFS transporter [Pantoea dispersa]|uniref:MFS transporter n=1 Tax=Pantoea dispersa TaxID=59814 RepID=UPI000FDC62E5|nr:MFS transporter [Pantoea dispersa]MCW0323471.1 putative L-galactonate transporter [Pantoea dispersa]MCW0328207.1 putative L-galactonate transporter [Pantoea dispersa]MCW0434594.1 putative L-galactonate transporter [Pantoea dispersa]RVU72101.1 MFS transporter [Pantoea dispersa]